jgi:hypothetical protein
MRIPVSRSRAAFGCVKVGASHPLQHVNATGFYGVPSLGPCGLVPYGLVPCGLVPCGLAALEFWIDIFISFNILRYSVRSTP